MDIQPQQMEQQTNPTARTDQPRDLTWLGLADERELLCLAREIAANNRYVNRAGKVFDSIGGDLGKA